MVLNSYETIYEGLVTRANDFAGRSSLVRMKMLVDNCDNIAFSTFSPKWIQMKKITMQTLKVWSVNNSIICNHIRLLIKSLAFAYYPCSNSMSDLKCSRISGV